MSATLLQPQSECVHEVLEAARRGDRDAFTALVTPHAPQIRRIACRLTRNVEDAEDVCQESLLKAFTKLDQFVGTEEVARDEFRFWLMKIATNCAIDFMRRKQASRLLPLEECDHLHSKPYQAGTGGWGENPETSCARQERLSVVVDAITRLPAGLRNACLLRNIMELTTKEAAERLGISTIALRLRLFRAHGQLRKRLGAVRKHCRHDHLEAKPRNVEYNSLPRNNVQTVLRYPPKAQYVCGD